MAAGRQAVACGAAARPIAWRPGAPQAARPGRAAGRRGERSV